MNFIRQSSLFIAVMVMGGCISFLDEPGTPLADAAHRGDVAALRALIADGADPSAFGPDGQTALHWAVRGGHPIGPHRDTPEAGDRLLVVDTLLDLGADPNLVDRRRTIPGGSSGWTPLHVALHHEQFRTATLLLQLLLTSGFDAERARRPGRR